MSTKISISNFPAEIVPRNYLLWCFIIIDSFAIEQEPERSHWHPLKFKKTFKTFRQNAKNWKSRTEIWKDAHTTLSLYDFLSLPIWVVIFTLKWISLLSWNQKRPKKPIKTVQTSSPIAKIRINLHCQRLWAWCIQNLRRPHRHQLFGPEKRGL